VIVTRQVILPGTDRDRRLQRAVGAGQVGIELRAALPRGQGELPRLHDLPIAEQRELDLGRLEVGVVHLEHHLVTRAIERITAH
jgi:hypothetical protein